MRYPDIMIDIETLDTLPTAMVDQIGMVCFDSCNPEASFFIKQWYVKTSPQVGIRTTSPETLKWRAENAPLRENHDARADYASQALTNLLAIYESMCLPECRVWANGPHFDLIILEGLMRDLHITPPWDFQDWRDFRTLTSMAPTIERHKPITPHLASSDAEAQARTVTDIIWNTGIHIQGNYQKDTSHAKE